MYQYLDLTLDSGLQLSKISTSELKDLFPPLLGRLSSEMFPHPSLKITSITLPKGAYFPEQPTLSD